MADKIVRRDSRGTLIDVQTTGQGTGATAVEESPEAKKRRVEKAWNDRYFASMGYSGLGGAAKIEAYKTANPDWTKARDKWAQAQVKPKPAPKPGSTLGSLAGVKP